MREPKGSDSGSSIEQSCEGLTEERVREPSVLRGGELHPGNIEEYGRSRNGERSCCFRERRGEAEEVKPEVDGGESMDRYVELEREEELRVGGHEEGRVDEHQTPIHEGDESFDWYAEDPERSLKACEQVDRREDILQEGEQEHQPCDAEAVPEIEAQGERESKGKERKSRPATRERTSQLTRG